MTTPIPTTNNKRSTPIYRRAHYNVAAVQLAKLMPTYDNRSAFKQWQQHLAATILDFTADNPKFNPPRFTAAIIAAVQQELHVEQLQDMQNIQDMQTGENGSELITPNCKEEAPVCSEAGAIPDKDSEAAPFGMRT